jgi:hypothetical protein
MPANWQKYLLEAFAVLTVLLDGAHVLHWMPVEVLVLLSSIITAVLAFLQPKAEVQILPKPVDYPIPTGTPPRAEPPATPMPPRSPTPPPPGKK